MTKIGGAPPGATPRQTPQTTSGDTASATDASTTAEAKKAELDHKHPPIGADEVSPDADTVQKHNPSAQTSAESQARFAHDTSALLRQQELTGTHTRPRTAHAKEAEHGHATAGGAGGAAKASFKTTQAGVDALKKDYGVNVKDGTAKWSPQELATAHDSFARMSKSDRAKLQGLDLVRDKEASAAVKAEAGHDHDLAGVYQPNVKAKDGKRVKPPAIHMYDNAFPKGGDADKNRAASMNVFLHEAGHAVEGRARDDAAAKVNETGTETDKHRPAFEQTSERLNSALDGFRDAQRALPRTRDKTLLKLYRANGKLGAATASLGKAKTPAAAKAGQAKVDAALKARDAALAGIAEDHPNRSEVDNLVESQNEYAAAWKAHGEAAGNYWPAQNAHDRANTALKRLENSDGVSKPLQDFNRFRAGAGESEDKVSDYAGTSPAEDFAEHYALYRRDPDHMKKNFPQAFKWFSANYR